MSSTHIKPFRGEYIKRVNIILRNIYGETEFWGVNENGVSGLVKPVNESDDKEWSNYNFLNSHTTCLEKIIFPHLKSIVKSKDNVELEMWEPDKGDESEKNVNFFRNLWKYREEIFGLSSVIKDDIVKEINFTRNRGKRTENKLIEILNKVSIISDVEDHSGDGDLVDFSGLDVSFTYDNKKRECQVKTASKVVDMGDFYRITSKIDRIYTQNTLIFGTEHYNEFKYYVFQNKGILDEQEKNVYDFSKDDLLLIITESKRSNVVSYEEGNIELF
jgi:hypothetical protein